MSYRRSLSFAEEEKSLLREFDGNGKSDFAKEAMKFFIKFKDKVFIIPDGSSINTKINNQEHKKEIKKLIK